jgi:hypothetical protein
MVGNIAAIMTTPKTIMKRAGMRGCEGFGKLRVAVLGLLVVVIPNTGLQNS